MEPPPANQEAPLAQPGPTGKGKAASGLLTRISMIGFCLLSISIFLYVALKMPETTEITDYACTFYVPGKLIATGRLSELYPSPADKRLADTAYNKAVHEILPHVPHHIDTAYSYPPIVALMVSPLTYLPPASALLVFQGLSLLALWVSAFLVAECQPRRTEQLFCGSFLFLPLLIAVMIGQLDLLVGLLPYSLMYFLLHGRKPFAAGLCGSLAFLKPQLVLIPGIVALVLLLNRQWKAAAGMALGVTLLLLSTLAWGPEMFGSWITAIKLQEADFLSPQAGVPRQLAMSIPRLILFLVPLESIPLAKPFVYALAAGLILTVVVALRRFLTREKDWHAALNVMFAAACLTLPLAAPHLFYYDLVVLSLAGWLAFSPENSDRWRRFLVPRTRLLWTIMSIYAIVLINTFGIDTYLPLLVLLPTLIVFCNLIVFIWGVSSKNAEEQAT